MVSEQPLLAVEQPSYVAAPPFFDCDERWLNRFVVRFSVDVSTPLSAFAKKRADVSALECRLHSSVADHAA